VQASVTGEEAFAVLGRNRAEIQQTLTDRFRQAITDGDLAGDEDPEELAGFLITVTTGFAIRAGDGDTRETLLAHARRALRSFP
jgi:GGDEF domain-containing protein